MKEASVSIKTYTFTWLSLLALTLITTLIGFVDLGVFTMVIAVGIAALKAATIAAIFMHALLEAKLVKVVIAGGMVWFLIMVTLTMSDYVTRGWVPFPGK
jgi:cytochrome c oxidase subunit IV